jgi:4-amino-4-deoxy-L-arabinose transferase-like glycosyltransferase
MQRFIPSVLTPSHLCVLALFVALTLPRMAQPGMFGDGLAYAVFSRNMSMGIGTFWAPTFTPTTDLEWFEHPPLALGLQALAFRVLGDHLYVERLFSLLMLASTALLIVAIWRRLQGPGYAWLPVLFWLLPASVTWAAVNNMLENTQTVFTTAAVLLIVVGARAASNHGAGAYACIAGVGIAAAVLCKGPVGFFPLALPALTWFLPHRPAGRRIVVMTAAMAAVVVFIAAMLWAWEPAQRSLTAYIQTQLLPSLRGARDVNPNPFAAVRYLGLGVVAPMVVILALLRVLAGRVAQLPQPAWFRLAGAVAASVPITISPKIAGHYFVPSVPLFALGLASWTLPSVIAIAQKTGPASRRVLVITAATLLVAAVAVPFVRGPVSLRNPRMVSSLKTISDVIPRDQIIGVCEQAADDWVLHAYLSRFFRVSLQAASAPVNGWMLVADQRCSAPPPCALAAAGVRLALYKCPGMRRDGSETRNQTSEP